MTVCIAGRRLDGASGLSEVGRMALAFIDGGPEWLAWAMGNPSVRHDFAEETELAAAVQFELHASRFALLPHLGVSVSPVKLMTLGLADLRTLARAESGDDSAATTAQVRMILSAHGLATGADLASGAALLNRLGVGDAPVFQILDFEDRLALYGLTQIPGDDDGSLGREAAAFAVLQARTPLEFADYYRFYLALAEKLGTSDDTRGRRQQMAGVALQTLLPLLFGYLGGPQVSGLPAVSEVAAALGDCYAKGGRVGFSRLSEGARQIVERTDYTNETGDTAQRLVERYVSDTASFLASHPRVTGRMGQDGKPSYEVVGGAQLAELKLGSTGVISLGDFRILPDGCPPPQ